MNYIKLFEDFDGIDPDAKIRHRGHCVFPAENSNVKDNKDHFPINNKKQGRNALARVQQYDKGPTWYDGTLEEVYKEVENKFSSININDDDD